MKPIRSLMGRRQFLIAACVTSTSALVFKKLATFVAPGSQRSIAKASELAETSGMKRISNKYSHLLSPLKIGNVILKNRMYSTNAVPHNLQGPENFPAEPSRSYAANLAKNGAAIVTCRIIQNRVRKELHGDSAHMVIYDLEDTGVQNYLDQLVEGIHCFDSKASVPLNISLPGEALPGTPAAMVAPGEGGRPGGAGATIMASLAAPPAEISEEVSQKLIEDAVEQVKFFQSHGFDMTCLRTPNVKDRVRFGIELYQAVKNACGQDFLIESPITIIEPSITSNETASAFTLDEAIALAKQWEGLVDILQIRVSGGGANHPDGFNQEKNKPLTLRFAQAIKESGANIVTAPNGGFNNLDFNEECIATGKTDMIAMGRPFIADWEYGKKAYEGRGEDTVPCIMCNKCHGGGQNGPWFSFCSVNPKMGIDSAVRIIEPPSAAKEVAVIGGGPAGLRAAVTAAERGHKVTLYEKNDFLGGQARHADFSPFKWPLKDFKDHLIRQVNKLGVEVLLNRTATPDMIKSKGYDAVLVAVGAEPIIPHIPGADGSDVWNVLNVYGKEKSLGKNVAFIGGGAIGAETAMYLAKYGHNVTVLTSERQLVQPAGPHQLGNMIGAYQQMDNFTPVTEAVTTRISDGKVTYRDASGSEKSIRADSVVIYAGLKPLQDEALKFSVTAAQFFIIGECKGLGNGVQKSQRSAFFAASQV